MTKVGSGSFVSCYINKSMNGTGNYTYRIYANDSNNNINSNKMKPMLKISLDIIFYFANNVLILRLNFQLAKKRIQ